MPSTRLSALAGVAALALLCPVAHATPGEKGDILGGRDGPSRSGWPCARGKGGGVRAQGPLLSRPHHTLTPCTTTHTKPDWIDAAMFGQFEPPEGGVDLYFRCVCVCACACVCADTHDGEWASRALHARTPHMKPPSRHASKNTPSAPPPDSFFVDRIVAIDEKKYTYEMSSW